MCATRYAAVFPLSEIINFFHRVGGQRHEELPHSYQMMLFWAGLRGAVGVALAAGFKGPNAAALRTTVLVVVVLTVIIFGGTTARMLEVLGIKVGVEEDGASSDDEEGERAGAERLWLNGRAPRWSGRASLYGLVPVCFGLMMAHLTISPAETKSPSQMAAGSLAARVVGALAGCSQQLPKKMMSIRTVAKSFRWLRNLRSLPRWQQDLKPDTGAAAGAGVEHIRPISPMSPITNGRLPRLTSDTCSRCSPIPWRVGHSTLAKRAGAPRLRQTVVGRHWSWAREILGTTVKTTGLAEVRLEGTRVRN